MRWGLLTVSVLVLASGCTDDGPGTGPPREKTGIGDEVANCANAELIDVSKEPNYSANYLHRWQTADGCDVRLDLLMMRQGDNACGGEKVADILMTWPLGSVQGRRGEYRIFVKDPTGVFNDERTTELYEEEAELPEEARDTGFRQDEVQLWMVPDDDTFIYLVEDGSAERWPLDESPAGCA